MAPPVGAGWGKYRRKYGRTSGREDGGGRREPGARVEVE